MTRSRAADSGPAAIEMVDLAAAHRELREPLTQAVTRVSRSGQFILGPEVERFEQAIADYCGARCAVGVGSGSDALVIALRVAGVRPGDVVISSAMSFVATAEAVVRCGARLRFVDVDADTLTMSATAVERYLSRCPLRQGQPFDPLRNAPVRALLPVHLYGRVANLTRLQPLCRAANLALVQDAAQAVGARAADGRPLAAHGPACLSFFPTKNLGAWGDGGALLIDDDDGARQARRLRLHGRDGDGRFGAVGYNSRLDALQAAVLSTKMSTLPAHQRARRKLASDYRRAILSASLAPHISPPPALGDGDVAHLFTICVRGGALRRSQLRRHLQRRNIASRVYYPEPLHTQPAFAEHHYENEALPNTELACNEVLSLPLHPYLSEDDVGRVVQALKDFANNEL